MNRRVRIDCKGQKCNEHNCDSCHARKLVLIKVETIVLMEFEEKYATKDHIEFALNQSHCCASNTLERLAGYDYDNEEQCGCDVTTQTVVQIGLTESELEARQYIDIRDRG